MHRVMLAGWTWKQTRHETGVDDIEANAIWTVSSAFDKICKYLKKNYEYFHIWYIGGLFNNLISL